MGTRRKLSDIQCVVIHCADTPNGRNNSAADIDRWHGERGFARDLSIAPDHQPQFQHIGYHFVIELNGSIVAGRPLTETGSHVAGSNRNTVGVCLIGRNQFTAEQWNSLHELITNLLFQIPSCAQIVGHRELNPGKDCPGFDVQQWIDNQYIPDFNHVLPETDHD